LKTVEASSDIRIPVAQPRCWEFFSDLANICRCIPGYESFEALGPNGGRLKVKVTVGFISKAFELKVRLSEIKEPSSISFAGEGSDAEVLGEVRLSGDGSGGTVVTYTVQIEPVSAMGRTAVGMFGQEFVNRQAEEFAKCVKQKLTA